MKSIRRVLDIVERFREKPFLIDSLTTRVFTFGDFHRAACSLAVELRKRGIQHGDRIAVVLNNSPELAVLYFSCLYLGAAVVPVNPQLHQREIEFILNNSGTTLVVYSPSTKHLVASGRFTRGKPGLLCVVPKTDSRGEAEELHAWSLETAEPANPDGWKPLDDVVSGDLLSITFTSGTTSQPKAVCHRIGSLLESAIAFNDELGFGTANRFYHVLAMTYMAGFLNTLLCPFLAGASVIIGRMFDARLAVDFWDSPMKHEVNTLWLVPTILAALMRLDRSQAGLAYCREHIGTVCVGTAPLPRNLKREFEDKYKVGLFESYGLSETLFVTTNSPNGSLVEESVGRELPGVSLKIVDDKGGEVQRGTDGEIWIRTPFLMTGYLNYEKLEPDLADSSEWFPSGDMGRLSPDGHLFITGRKKDLIIRGGINISPRAIEDVLVEHESVAQVSVVGMPHEFYGEEVVVAVKLKDGCLLEAVRPSLELLCKKHLSAVAIPTKYFVVENFPATVTGKVQKGKLREMLATMVSASPGGSNSRV